MRKVAVVFSAFLLICLVTSAASAATISLFEWTLNVNGTIYTPGDTPPGSGTLDLAGTGLGTWTVSHTAVGLELYFVTLFVDHEIDEALNTFFNEFGSVAGAPAAGQRWEIDEPGYVFGDIYDNVLAGGQALDDLNGVPSAKPDDVSMAMSWNFLLAAGETATAKFLLSETAPTGGLYLQHTDPDSDANIYFSGSASIQGGGGPTIPEPGTIALVLSGLGLVAASRFRKSA